MESTGDTKTSADPTTLMAQLEAQLSRLTNGAGSGTTLSEVEKLFQETLEAFSDDPKVQADACERALAIDPKCMKEQILRFLTAGRRLSVLEELLLRGHRVTDILVLPTRFQGQDYDLRRYPDMSQTQRMDVMKKMSEALFRALCALTDNLVNVRCLNGYMHERACAKSNVGLEPMMVRIIQASNKSASGVVAGLLNRFRLLPENNLHDFFNLFRCLCASGYDPTKVMRFLFGDPRYQECMDAWRSQSQLSLKHLARQAVRDAITTNVVHAAPRLGLPASLQSYLLLEDAIAEFKDAVVTPVSSE